VEMSCETRRPLEPLNSLTTMATVNKATKTTGRQKSSEQQR